MAGPAWQIRPLNFNEEDHGISEWDQFDKEQRNIEITLLREAIQNSLDARDADSGQPVEVRIAWHAVTDANDIEFVEGLIAPLEPHLEASGRKIARDGAPTVLVIEDFGTKGLVGRTDDQSDTGHFRSFFFGHSSSHKRPGAGGRWGLGKLVFASMSGASCWFGLTRRFDDGRTLLMGKAAIGSRVYDGRTYPAFARWAVLDTEGREMPVEDERILARFREVFGLTRRDEPGLSVIVPRPKVAANVASVRRQVLTEWVVPILRNRLIVEINDQRIDRSAAATLAKDELGPAVAKFVAEVAHPSVAPVELPEVRAHPLKDVVPERLTAEALNELRAAYARSELVATRLPTIFMPKEGKERCAHVRVCLQRIDPDQKPFALRLRGDISVPDAAKLSVEGVMSALVAEDGPAAEFLADAEPPAHDNWMVTERLKAKWKYAPDTLKLVRRLPAKLHELLAAGAEEELPDELLDYFWFEGQDSARPQEPSGGRQPKPPQPGRPDPPPPRPRRLTVQPETGGFMLKAGPGLTVTDLPCRVEARVAYDVEEGDPFKRWSPLDFDFSEETAGIEIDADGAEIVERQGYALVVEARDLAFRVRVGGFDPNRDLDIRVHRLADAEP